MTPPDDAGFGTDFAGASDYKPLKLVDPRDLALVPVPERVWIVEDWLPVQHVTLSYGDGGVGKTLLSHQLMTACATGALWLGLQVTRCNVFGIFCEDHEEEVHRRQDKINAALGVDYPDLGDMRWACAVGADNALVRFEPDGYFSLTPRFHELVRLAKDHGTKLLVIDTAADTFGGNENDRRQVRIYLGAVLTKLAIEIKGAVLVNAHPSRSGMSSTGDMDGGSTAWSNTARSRWALLVPRDEEGKVTDEDLRVLSRRKANYARMGEEIELRWTDGVLMPANQKIESGLAGANRLMGAEYAFLTLLDRCTAQNVFLSASDHASNYAPKLLSKRPDRQGYTRSDFAAAMHSLFANNRLTNLPYGRKSDTRFRIGTPGEAEPNEDDGEAQDLP